VIETHTFSRDVTQWLAGAVVVVVLLAGLRVLAGRALGGGRAPRMRVRGMRRGRGLPWLLGWVLVAGPLRLLGRLVGKVARGGTPPEAGATWFRSAQSVQRRPSLDPLAGRPGVVRVLVYLVLPVVLAVGFLRWLEAASIVTAIAVVGGTAAWAGRYEARRRRERDEAAFLAMAPYLDLTTPAVEDYRAWLAVPRNVRDQAATITVRLPRHWAGTDRQREGIESIISQRFPGAWEPNWQPAQLAATFTRPPQPPALVPFVDDGGPADRFPMGVNMRGQTRHIDFSGETPNVLISASPGWGKTLFIALVVAWFVSRGATAILLDGKQTSYLKGPRRIPPGQRGFAGVPGITIHADLPAMMQALTDTRREMDRRYRLRREGVDIDDETEFPSIILAIDEISRFTTEVRMWWQGQRGKGQPPCFADYLAILWQGREARIFVVVGVHNPNARVLVSGDARAMFATRIAAGPQDAGAWRMLFGNRPVPRFSSRKGRAWVAMGVDADEYQLAYADLQQARELALTRTRPGVPAHVPGPDVPPPGQTLSPAENPFSVRDSGTFPASVPQGRLTWPPTPQQASPAPFTRPEADTGPSPAESLIVGLAAAAKYLGTTAEAFRKARRRNGPIPGERRIGNSPAWPGGQLRDWYARLPRAGRNLPPPDTDRRLAADCQTSRGNSC
jgi:hypothetical protein